MVISEACIILIKVFQLLMHCVSVPTRFINFTPKGTFVNSFSEFELSPLIQKSIQEMGFTSPSPIQQQALPLLLKKSTDFIGLAATGTGKTAAFGIPLIERIDANKKSIQALVMCPTRELAIQVSQQINLLGRHKGVRTATVYGGADYGEQIRQIKSGATIVVGTPGRLVDHLERGSLKLGEVRTVVLDEADEMISMGFRDDLEQLLGDTPKEGKNIWLFSATMSKEVRKVADKYLHSPEQVSINRTEMLPSQVEQTYYTMRESDKPEILCKIIDLAEEFYGIIFCQTKMLVTDLTQYMIERGYKVDCLHGDKDQKSREKTMQAFRDKRIKVLICTDVASRGLDVKEVTHVVNYSIPRETEVYVHRIGRTARGGSHGKAISLVTPAQKSLLIKVEKLTKVKVTEAQVPSRKEVGVKRLNQVLEKFKAQTHFAKSLELFSSDWNEALANMSAQEVAARFLVMSFPEVFSDKNQQVNQVRPQKEDTRQQSRKPSFRDRNQNGQKPRRFRFAKGGGHGGGNRQGASRPKLNS